MYNHTTSLKPRPPAVNTAPMTNMRYERLAHAARSSPARRCQPNVRPADAGPAPPPGAYKPGISRCVPSAQTRIAAAIMAAHTRANPAYAAGSRRPSRNVADGAKKWK